MCFEKGAGILTLPYGLQPTVILNCDGGHYSCKVRSYLLIPNRDMVLAGNYILLSLMTSHLPGLSP